MFRKLSLVTLVAFAFVAGAQAQHFDVFVATSGTETVGGGVEVDTGEVVLGQVVFEAELGDVGGQFISDEPGFNHPADDSVIPAGIDSLNMGDEIFVRGLDLTAPIGGPTAPLFYWDGTGTPSFAPSSATFVINTGNTTGSIGTAGAGGGFDDHPFFEVTGGPLGIYLASFEHEVGGFSPSGPNFLVLGTEGLVPTDEELEGLIELGVDYVNANVIPEPNAFVLAGIGFLAMMLGRRSSRQ